MKNQTYKYLITFILAVLFLLPVHADDRGITILDLNSSDVSWSPNGKWIAYAKVTPQQDKFNDVWLVRPDATDHVNLSKNWKDQAGFPNMHVGGISWHPSMEYMVIVALNNDVVGQRFQQLGIPGSDANCNLWLTSSDGTKVWQLTGNGSSKGSMNHHASSLRTTHGAPTENPLSSPSLMRARMNPSARS